MNKLLQIAHLALVLTGMGALVCLGWAMLQIGDASRSLTIAAQGVTATITKLNSQNGTIAETDKLLLALKSTTVHADIVLDGERKNQVKYDADLDRFATGVDRLTESGATTLDSLSGTAAALTGTANAATATLGEGQRTIAAAQPLMAAYTRSGDDLGLLIRDNAAPLHATLVHAAGMSASGDKMLADAQWKTHQLLHPDKVKLGFWGAAWAGVKAIHAIEPPIF